MDSSNTLCEKILYLLQRATVIFSSCFPFVLNCIGALIMVEMSLWTMKKSSLSSVKCRICKT